LRACIISTASRLQAAQSVVCASLLIAYPLLFNRPHCQASGHARAGTLCPVDLRSALHLLRYPVGQKLLREPAPNSVRPAGSSASRPAQSPVEPPAGRQRYRPAPAVAGPWPHQARCCRLQAQVEMLKHQITPACACRIWVGG
jgi:hypothetical protein